jgi:hypothetical protein
MTDPRLRTVRAAARLLLAGTIVSVVPRGAEAQRSWLGPTFDRSVEIELIRPFLRGDGASLTYAAGMARIPLGTSTALTVELPLSLVRVDGVEFPSRPEESAVLLGNPWIGVEYRGSGELLVQAGIRPGIYRRTDDAGFQAYYGAFVADLDHFEAWLPKTSTGRVEVQFGRLPAKGFAVSGRAGASLFYNISSGGGDPEVFGDYGLRAGWWGDKIAASVTVDGRAIVTTPGGSFADRTEHRLGGRVEWLSGSIRPWVQVRTPLDDFARQVARVIGAVGVSATF